MAGSGDAWQRPVPGSVVDSALQEPCQNISDAICFGVSPAHKPLVFLSGATIKTPPLTAAARGEAGYLLRQLQAAESLALPRSRPMPSIGAR